MEWWLSHWPFFAAAFIFWSIGNVMKRVISKTLAARSKVAWLFRATMPIHPVILGAALGALVPSLPASDGVATAGGKALYFAAAGVSCNWIFNWVRHWAAMKNIRINGSGPSLPPAPPS